MIAKEIAYAIHNNIHLVSLGNGGCKVLKYFYKQNVDAKYTCVLHQPCKLPPQIQYVNFEAKKTSCNYYNAKTEKNIELSEAIKRVFAEESQYVLLVGLGGYTGTLLLELLYEYLSSQKKEFVIIGSYPFRFEGNIRKEFAIRKTQAFYAKNNFIYFELEQIRYQYPNLLVSEAFEKANKEYYTLFKLLFYFF